MKVTHINACTQRLGDTLHAYAITLALADQAGCQRRFRVRAGYAGLFVSSPLQIVRQKATWWRHDGSFHGPCHGQHVRDTMATCAGIGNANLAIQLSMAHPSHARTGNYVVICPHAAAHAPYKEWPLGRWAVIAEMITSLGFRVLVCGMPGRKPLKLPASAMSLTLDPTSLGSLLAGAMAIVGPDSGHIHLADALGIPVIGLYAATSATTYGPYSDSRHCIDHHRDTFPAGVIYNSSKHIRNSCMQIIDPDTVADRITAVCGPHQP